jgi:hypothetical protein
MPSKDSQQKIKYAPIQSEDTEWMLGAACRGVPMVDGYSIFFPKIVHSPGRPAKASHHDAPLLEFYEEAYALCMRCPVINECRTEYIRDPIPKDGMYFGKTPSQRTRLRNKE